MSARPSWSSLTRHDWELLSYWIVITAACPGAEYENDFFLQLRLLYLFFSRSSKYLLTINATKLLSGLRSALAKA
jgi:hypothetical protein